MKVNGRLIKKILSVVLTVAMTVGMLNGQVFVSEVKAATTIKFVGNASIAADSARIYVVEGTVSDSSAYRNGSSNEMTAGKEMTRSTTEDYTWTAEVDSDVVTFVRVSPVQSNGVTYYWGWEWLNTQRGDNSVYTATATGTGEWGDGTKNVTFTIKNCISDSGRFAQFQASARLFLCDDGTHTTDGSHKYSDGHEFTQSSDSKTWTVTIPEAYAKSGNLKIERVSYTDNDQGKENGTIWGVWNLESTDISGKTYYITDFLDGNRPGTACLGQWNNPDGSGSTDNIYGEQLTGANYTYNFDNLKLAGMTDTNTDESSRNTLFTVPAVMYNYKKGGGDSWWDQFQNFDDAMKEKYWGTGKITHPLATGAPDSRNWILNDDINAVGSRPLYKLLGMSSTDTIDDRLWYTNHNIAGDGNGNNDTSLVGSPLQGLAAPYLSTNRQLLSSENNVIMPFFDDNFLKDYADIYGTMENPIQFPFRVTGDGHYIFDSKSGQDNVYMNADGNLVYNSNSSVTITNPSENAGETVGFFPFNTPISGNVNDNATLSPSKPEKEDTSINYGFGMRLGIPFTISDKTSTENAKKISLTRNGVDGSAAGTIYQNFSVTNSTAKYVVVKLSEARNVNVDNIRINGTDYWLTNGNATITYPGLTKYDNENVVSLDNNNDGYILVALNETTDISSVSVGYRAYADDAVMQVYALSNESEITNLPEIKEDTVFRFSGDDDLWVYVDGKLALDVGGAHGRATGSINFTTGEVNVDNPYKVTDTGIEKATASSTQDWIKNLDKSKTHTLSVFYMERGLYDSNLMIDFNLDAVDLTQKNGLTVTNTMDLSNIQSTLQNNVTKIMEKDKFTYNVSDLTDTSKTLFGNNNISFGGNGTVTQTEEVDGSTDNGIRDDRVSIKQKEDKRFDTSYTVSDRDGEKFTENISGLDASDNRTDGENSVTVQNKTAAAVGEDVAVKVDYLNAAKATGFSIAKEFVGTESASSYTFEVKYTQLFGADNETYGLDGSLAGVTYTVYNSDTNEKIEDKTVSSDSTIEISKGQKAVFTGIPVNTKIKVTELNAAKTFKNVKVSGSDESSENDTFTTNEGTMATLALTNKPEFVFTNTESDVRRLVYYTEVGKTTNLPLPSDLTAKTTKEGQSETTTTVSHEKTASISMTGADSQDITVSTTISNVQANINGSNEHKIKITSPAQGGYGIKAITINGNTYGYDAIKNQYLTGTCGTLLEGWLVDVSGTITIPFTMTGDGDVNVSINYRGWSVSYVWPVVLDEGVTTTETVPGTESVTVNDYTLNDTSSDITFTHDADSSNRATLTWENGNVSDTSSINKMTFTSKHVGYDKFVLKLADNINNGTQKVEVVVYNYNVNDKVYVLDYGLKTDLFADTNGILGGTTPYNYDKNFSVTNKSILQDDTDADGYTVLGISDSTVGANYRNSLNYTYSDGEFKNQMDFNQATALWADSKLMYTPKKFMSDVDTFYMGVQVTKDGIASGESSLDASNATPVMTSKVEVMPANIVYYEDNFSNSGTDNNDATSGIIYSGNVTIEGTSKDSTQSNALDMQYGYDPAYEGQDSENSEGSAHQLYPFNMAAFEFTGTGFDIISRTNRNTGVIIVEIYKKNNDTVISKETYGNKDMLFVDNADMVESLIVDTSYENGDLYQIPVISWKNGDNVANNYIVTITALKGNNPSAKYVYIDGIRIYNPAKGNTTAEDAYKNNNELNTNVKEVKNLILGENFKFNYDEPLKSTGIGENTKVSLVRYEGNGAQFYAGKTVVESFNGYDIEDSSKEASPNVAKDLLSYAAIGPNNELYLEPGYGIAFGYTADSSAENKTIQLGIKNVEKNHKLTLEYLKQEQGASSPTWEKVADITSATEQYYVLDTLTDKYLGNIYLRISGDGGFASLTSIKVVGYELNSINLSDSENREEDSSLNPTAVELKSGYNSKSESFISGSYAVVKVTTPVGVDDLKLYNGDNMIKESVASGKVNQDGNTMTWTLKFKPDENIKTDKISIICYGTNGKQSQKVKLNSIGKDGE